MEDNRLDKLLEVMLDFKKDFQGFRDEMLEFKGEMLEFKKEMYKFRDETNERFDKIDDHFEFLALRLWDNEKELYRIKKKLEHT